jgi:hypothetical protein
MAEKSQRESVVSTFVGDDGGWGSLEEPTGWEPGAGRAAGGWESENNTENGWELEEKETDDTNGGWWPENNIEDGWVPVNNTTNGWEPDKVMPAMLAARMARRMAALETENKLPRKQKGRFICPLRKNILF